MQTADSSVASERERNRLRVSLRTVADKNKAAIERDAVKAIAKLSPSDQVILDKALELARLEFYDEAKAVIGTERSNALAEAQMRTAMDAVLLSNVLQRAQEGYIAEAYEDATMHASLRGWPLRPQKLRIQKCINPIAFERALIYVEKGQSDKAFALTPLVSRSWFLFKNEIQRRMEKCIRAALTERSLSPRFRRDGSRRGADAPLERTLVIPELPGVLLIPTAISSDSERLSVLMAHAPWRSRANFHRVGASVVLAIDTHFETSDKSPLSDEAAYALAEQLGVDDAMVRRCLIEGVLEARHTLDPHDRTNEGGGLSLEL